jgi:hypothetical protein
MLGAADTKSSHDASAQPQRGARVSELAGVAGGEWGNLVWNLLRKQRFKGSSVQVSA